VTTNKLAAVSPASPRSTLHASAVLTGARAVLIRGPSAAGKSRLALDLIGAAASGLLPFARLVADDRADLEAAAGRLLVRPAAALAGLIEVRGLGIRRLPYEPVAVVGLVVDLAAADAQRLPQPERARTHIAGVTLARLAVGPEEAPLPLVIAALRLTESGV
jgi:HPr kinase/phosphorylase